MLRAAASLPHSPRSVKPFQASLFSAWLCGPVTTLHPYGFCWLVHSLGLRIQSDVSKALGAPDFWNDGSSLGASQPRAGAAVDDFTLREATAAPYMSRRAPFEVGSFIQPSSLIIKSLYKAPLPAVYFPHSTSHRPLSPHLSPLRRP
jgi:hypothetical protein